MFNSYYEGVGPQFTRAQRGTVTRPGAREVGLYRRAVDDAMCRLLNGPDASRVADLVDLGLHHEQQHQELLLMDIKHALSLNPLRPVYRLSETTTAPPTDPLAWMTFDGGVVEIGHGDDGFSFDNETPRHRAYVEPFALADRLVHCREWLEFMADGGYDRFDLWLSDGWAAVRNNAWRAPLYWQADGSQWLVHTLGGTRPVDPGEPVCHISHFEADAFARWAGARLPTEQEWEHASSRAAPERSFDLDHLHPRATRGEGLRQMFGECWQWTSSAYLPYPGFAPAPGAVGEYNGKFMSGQMVLRGSCAFTPQGHARPTYRNFFPAHTRWMLSGVRLARTL
jgi:ergothioneine biosynthesis protein EgtB